jgi:proton-dependent oligopeptide transporter, POT family
MFKKHPAGLPFLFFTEMWERFGYYLMIGIFTLYMKDTQKGGLSMSNANAADIFGTFIALVYLTPFIGGLLADRVFGFRKSIIFGGILMGLGYLVLSIPPDYFGGYSLGTFWLALFLMILGNGFFKPNISTLLGNLYNEEKYREHKDEGYSIFYMGINIGALVCNFVAAYLRNTYGWGYAFAAAGVGMFIGVAVFAAGLKNYAHADVVDAQKSNEGSVVQILSSVMLPAIAVGVAAWFIPGNIFGSDSTDAFIFGVLPVIAFYLWTLKKASLEDKPRIKVLLAMYAVVVVFWAVFKQNGTALTNWAENYTDRSYPALMEKPASFMGMLQSDTVKMQRVPVVDNQFRVARDADKKVVKEENYPIYLRNIPKEKWPAEGSGFKLISTEIFQSVNPFFVVVLTPLLLWAFTYLRKRQKEPTTPGKIGWGLIISALSTLVTVAAVWSCHNGETKASAWWIITTYAVITVGELCLSPMGLSMVSKMAPRHLAGLMMGGWQLATSFGNKLSGVLASMWDKYDDKANFFWVNCALLAAAAMALFMMLKWANRIFKEAGLR